MNKNRAKRRATLLLLALALVSACAHSTKLRLQDGLRMEKAKGGNRAGGAQTSVKAWESSDAVSKTNTAVRPLQSGQMVEQVITEIADGKADVARHPNDINRRFKLALLYHNHGLLEQASTEYHYILNQDPKYAPAYERLGKLWLDWGVSNRALSAAEKAIALRPDFAEAYNTLGLIHDARKDHDLSQEAYRRALAIRPELDYAHNNLCFSYARSRKYQDAVVSCREALRLNPKNENAYNNLGYPLGMLGDFASAYQAFLSGGDEASAHNNLGVVQQEGKWYQEAKAHFMRALELKPDYRSAAENYAALATFLGKAGPSPEVGPSGTIPNSPQASAKIAGEFGPIAVIPPLPRRAEEKLLEAIAEKLQLRILTRQTESFSFNRDLTGAIQQDPLTPSSRASAMATPRNAAEAMELRSIKPLGSETLRHGVDPIGIMSLPSLSRSERDQDQRNFLAFVPAPPSESVKVSMGGLKAPTLRTTETLAPVGVVSLSRIQPVLPADAMTLSPLDSMSSPDYRYELPLGRTAATLSLPRRDAASRHGDFEALPSSLLRSNDMAMKRDRVVAVPSLSPLVALPSVSLGKNLAPERVAMDPTLLRTVGPPTRDIFARLTPAITNKARIADTAGTNASPAALDIDLHPVASLARDWPPSNISPSMEGGHAAMQALRVPALPLQLLVSVVEHRLSGESIAKPISDDLLSSLLPLNSEIESFPSVHGASPAVVPIIERPLYQYMPAPLTSAGGRAGTADYMAMAGKPSATKTHRRAKDHSLPTQPVPAKALSEKRPAAVDQAVSLGLPVVPMLTAFPSYSKASTSGPVRMPAKGNVGAWPLALVSLGHRILTHWLPTAAVILVLSGGLLFYFLGRRKLWR
ncbi:MAG: tetratricopeptide repeat protein [Acidobacteria bacterium]|nr:tetratricopeptide repeat protein [Acidobacteriota bacterium]MBI3655980.1 tetratricopeptide repeat protein [Acidobacteriota bacterium]